MGLRRILRVLRAKWWVVVLAAVIGGVFGVTIARSQNDSITPRWSAEAAVTFIQLDEAEEQNQGGARGGQPGGNSPTAVTIDVEAERTRAQLLLADALEESPSLSIRTDRSDNLLVFVAVDRDGEEALQLAETLRDEYQALGATVLSIDQIEVTMAGLLVDIDRLKGQIAELEAAEPPPEDPGIVARREALDNEISTLNQRQAQLRIWLVNPELRPTEDEYNGVDPDAVRGTDRDTEEDPPEEPVIVTVLTLQAEESKNSVVLSRLNIDLARLPEPPVAEELDAETELALEALILDVAEFEAQYVDLLRRSDGKPPGGFFVASAVTDKTATERPVALSGLIGLLAGGILASGTVIGIDRSRRPVWSTSDLEDVVCLGVVDRYREGEKRRQIWYPSSLSQRRRDIQTFRAAMDAATEEEPAIVGFAGVALAGSEVAELAADLAASYTVAGREVLLIDGNAFHPSSLPEFGNGLDKSVNSVLMTQMESDEAATAINGLLDDTTAVIPGLTALQIGGEINDPIDVFASPNCRVLMDIARARYDIVILAGPDFSEPLADAVIRRVDFVVLVGSLGHTTTTEISTASDVLADRRTDLAGVLLLKGRRQPVSKELSAIVHGDPRATATRASRGAARGVAKVKGLFQR